MKLLYITSLSGKRINGFMRSAIVAARKLNIDFTMACNTDMADLDGYAEDCTHYGIKLEHIDFDRNPISGKNNKAYKQLLALMQRENFDAVHCNTPIGGLLGRICAKKANVAYVIYQAHGFHFWNGAPLKNWLLYYPVERFLAHYTDLLITINREDYQHAQKFHLKKSGKLAFVHGVGVDIDKIENISIDATNKRTSFGIPTDATVFVTVGELNDNKNHKTAIEAFTSANIPNSYFIICGDGKNKASLQQQIAEKGMSARIILAGFRSDIFEILKASDIFLFPSFKEGLPGALMEAMAAGLPCVASSIRGNTDLLGENYNYLFSPKDTASLSLKLQQIVKEQKAYSLICKERIAPFAFDTVTTELETIYEKLSTEII